MAGIASPNLVTIGSFLVLAANIIWYRSKFMLKAKGYSVGWFSKHFDDYPNLIKAIESETDDVELSRLHLQRKFMLLIWFIFPLGAVLIFSGAK